LMMKTLLVMGATMASFTHAQKKREGNT